MRPVASGLIAVLLVATACTAAPPSAPSPAPAAATSSAAAPTPVSTTPPPSPTPTQKAAKPKPPNPISMAALIRKDYDGRDLKLGKRLGDNESYKRYLITYRGDDELISGVMNVPDGKGPFPVLVLNHGYINRDTYFPGQGMPREQDYLARKGYVVLHIDYRGHASSSNDPDVDYELRLPYTVDTINAVKAVKSSKLKFLDRDRVGWLGRSMGGEVTLRALVAQPGLVDAAVIYASNSSLAADVYNQFYRGAADRRSTVRRIEKTYGLPKKNPAFWRAASARPYLDRVTEPVLIHHGTADETCPIGWSRATVKALKAEGKDVTFKTYAGEGHTFERKWRTSIERTEEFFDDHLR